MNSSTFTFTVDDERFEVSGGNLKLKAGMALNFEAAASVPVVVTATDEGGLSISKAFSITVTNVNEAPVANNDSFGARLENQNGSAMTLNVIGNDTDPDAGQTATLTIASGSVAVTAVNTPPGAPAGLLTALQTAGVFTIDGTGKNIVFDNSGGLFDFLREGQSSVVTLTYQAQDTGALTSNTATVTLQILGVNDAPVLAAISNVTLSENDPAATAVATASATDLDTGDTKSFALIEGNDDGLFAIDASTGAITTTRTLDDPEVGVHNLVVQVTDGTGAVDTKGFSVTVTNVNEAPSAGADFAVTTLEDHPVNGVVQGSDPDGTTPTYSVFAQGALGTATIDADTGAFIYTPTLNANGTDTFTVRVSDGTLTDDTVVTVNITPVNDAPSAPVLASQVAVPENSGAGFVVGTLTAADVRNVSITTAASFAVSDSRFAVVNNGGVAELRVASGAVIDFETEKTIPVTVTATDAGGLTSSKTFTIAVSNVNEAPTAGADAFATAEDTPVTFTVLGNDSDPDAGASFVDHPDRRQRHHGRRRCGCACERHGGAQHRRVADLHAEPELQRSGELHLHAIRRRPDGDRPGDRQRHGG